MASLNRTLGWVSTSAIVVGTMIGASIFVQPTEIAAYVPDERAILGVWLPPGC